MSNTLEKLNQELHNKTLKKIEEIREKRKSEWYVDFDSYFINLFLNSLFEVLKDFDEAIKSKQDLELTYVDRNKFDADLCVKIPALLQKYKKEYVREVVPKLIDFLNNSKLVKQNIISKIDWIWIYLNISLDDKFLFSSIEDVFLKDSKFWENDLQKDKDIVVDYSSPNVAKHLHAGHIRSTIIGHVLSNIYEKNWYASHRVNHINDWGGFGFLIEWYSKWTDVLPEFENKNDLLFHIYTIYRKAEKASKSEEEFENAKTDLEKYFNIESFKVFTESYNEYIEASKDKFAKLESGEKEVVELWEQMVKWSLADFEKFYNLLGIHHDYVIWESFYAPLWVKLVEDLEKKWLVVLYNEQMANEDIQKLQEKLDKEEITEKMFEATKEEILRDIWAYVVLLDNFERFVVLKSDKSSIYATRDLAAIKYRADNYNPDKIIYEVWQEQAEHFDKLFKSAKKIGLDKIWFEHIYHGFYIDAKTKKKLSSRDWASNVVKLITESIEFFKNKYKDSTEFTKQQIEDIAYKMAIGSIIFNDIKSDKKNPVAISSDIQKTCEAFEESGWAYVMYSIVRANSILAKIDNLDEIKLEDVDLENLDNIEKQILNEITRFPLVVKQASENSNPAVIIEFVLNLSRYYNSYYNSHRVIDNDKLVKHRIFITKAVSKVLTNALKTCHIQVPERI